jgi:hypothetical protein
MAFGDHCGLGISQPSINFKAGRFAPWQRSGKKHSNDLLGVFIYDSCCGVASTDENSFCPERLQGAGLEPGSHENGGEIS